MRRSLTIAASIAATGALLAGPVAAATNNATCDGTGPKAGAGQGSSQGNYQGQRPGRGPGAGGGRGVMILPMGTLTDAQKAGLAYMAEEEKLAHDVYTVLAKKYPKTRVFSNIEPSEQRHLDAVRMLLSRYQVSDPTAGMKPGRFSSADLQVMYDDLLSSATTRTQALQVGVAIEEDDIAELSKAAESLTAPDVTQVYANLTKASQRHLAAFESRL